jgi:SET domain-containing protein
VEGAVRGLVDCDKVYVDASRVGGAGVFAARPFRAGEIVETGIVRRLPVGFDGHASPHVFTWSEDRTVWAIGSGCSTFYNCSTEPNTHMERDFANDRFTIRALRDVAEGEELTHTYKSLPWRACFEDLRRD